MVLSNHSDQISCFNLTIDVSLAILCAESMINFDKKYDDDDDDDGEEITQTNPEFTFFCCK